MVGKIEQEFVTLEFDRFGYRYFVLPVAFMTFGFLFCVDVCNIFSRRSLSEKWQTNMEPYRDFVSIDRAVDKKRLQNKYA